MDPAKQIIEKAKELFALRQRKEALEAELKTVNIKKSTLESQTLPKMMEDAEVEKMTIEGVGTLFTQQGVYAHIKSDDQAEAYDWLRENGHGSVIKETVYHQTLKAFAKEQLENGAQLPAFFNVKPTTTARIRKK